MMIRTIETDENTGRLLPLKERPILFLGAGQPMDGFRGACIYDDPLEERPILCLGDRIDRKYQLSGFLQGLFGAEWEHVEIPPTLDPGTVKGIVGI